jgi:hypothetical protein
LYYRPKWFHRRTDVIFPFSRLKAIMCLHSFIEKDASSIAEFFPELVRLLIDSDLSIVNAASMTDSGSHGRAPPASQWLEWTRRRSQALCGPRPGGRSASAGTSGPAGEES